MLDLKRCDGRWPSVLKEIGVPDAVLNGRNQACPFCGGTDRFRFTNHNGWGTFVCNQCQSVPGNGFTFVQRWLNEGPGPAAKRIEQVLPSATVDRAKKAEDRRPEMRKRWEAARRLHPDDPVSQYLRRRGLSPDTTSEIRCSLSEPYYDNGVHVNSYAAMLCLVRDGNGRGQTLHVTYLTPDGRKANVPSPKKVLSALGSNNPAIRLFPAVDGRVSVCEGVETALAIRHLTGQPVWALISASGMEKWRPPKDVNRVDIYADNDASATGQAAAYALAKSLASICVHWDVLIPDAPGSDFADMVRT